MPYLMLEYESNQYCFTTSNICDPSKPAGLVKNFYQHTRDTDQGCYHSLIQRSYYRYSVGLVAKHGDDSADDCIGPIYVGRI